MSPFNLPPKQCTMKIVYRCHERKKFFTRDVIIDDDFEIKRKMSELTFETKPHAVGPTMLLIRTVRGFTVKTSGFSRSIPCHLFGVGYEHAVRRDPTYLWNLSRSAYLLPIIA